MGDRECEGPECHCAALHAELAAERIATKLACGKAVDLRSERDRYRAALERIAASCSLYPDDRERSIVDAALHVLNGSDDE